MLWHDFFYFSKGERRGLIVLLCLIVVAGILLIWKSEPKADPGSAHAQADSKNVLNASKSTDSLSSGKSSAGKSSESVSSSAEGMSSKKNTYSSKKRSSSSSSTVKPSSHNTSALSDTDLTEQVKADGDGSESGMERGEISESAHKKESVSERVKRLTSSSRPSYPRVEKFREGTVVELNTADTTMLKKVPGIGSAFAKRIVNYRNILGGYYSVIQLSEVYGIDEEKYNALAPWFSADPSLISRLDVNKFSQDSLRRHPYINYSQAKVIVQLRRLKGKLTGWENLLLLSEFAEVDRIRLQHYLSFE